MLLEISREITPERMKGWRWDGWMTSRTRWTLFWVNFGSWWWKGGLVCWDSWSRKESEMTEQLNWTELMQYCFLQHRTLLPSPVTSATGCCFCFGSISPFFLELFLYWSPVAYWAPTDLGISSFRVLSFCTFILSVVFSRQEYWSDLPFLSPGDNILLGLTTMTHPSWVALHSMAHS